MRIASMHWMRKEPLSTAVARLARTGYDSIMLSGNPELYDGVSTRTQLEVHGLTAWGAVTLMDASRDLVHPDRDVRDATQEYFRRTIQFASDCGGEVLCCTPSSIGKLSPLSHRAAEWRWAVEGLRAAGEFAGSRGVRIAVEAISRFETYFVNTADQALQLVASVDLPNVGVCLDTYHMNMEEDDPISAVRAAGALLFDFHVAESNRKPPGRGLVPWKEMLSVLQEIRYSGALTAEVLYPRDRTPVTSAPEDDSGEFDADFYDAITAETSRFLRSIVPTA